ncbi:hypothetical protein CesoFtcFv8_005650 [Champsocephalus esox]|uniref:Uncharacterized protein n=2 Tax=Champsocephalus TaxID=52236 RepID=A0AAN8I3T2_CHAGU|nr:hypothetical protein CesoFtcFv8_005650 [Champsocephalus esox]KAK5931389.1 hypothetical protein CgunFtcFv8_027540 [Champsocephalus gunnari]
MEFLKSLVPGSLSGESPGDHGGVLPRDSGPRLLRMKRLSLLSIGQTIEENGANHRGGWGDLGSRSPTRLKGRAAGK